jgi:hypothetical protein
MRRNSRRGSRDRADYRSDYRSDYESDYRGDMRNPYGSRGGYVRDRRDMDYDMARGGRGRSRGYDRAMDSDYDYTESGSRYDNRYDRRYGDSRDYMGDQHYGEHYRPMEYEMYGLGGMRPIRDYAYDMGYDRDYNEEKEHKEYEEKLHEWINKLKKKDKFGLPKEEAIKKAKEMGVKFDKFDETELYAVYLMMVSDYRQISSEPHRYIAMAKDWLEDDDVKRKGSEKVCAYLYSIVLGED